MGEEESDEGVWLLKEWARPNFRISASSGVRVAHASRVLVSASRRNNLLDFSVSATFSLTCQTHTAQENRRCSFRGAQAVSLPRSAACRAHLHLFSLFTRIKFGGRLPPTTGWQPVLPKVRNDYPLEPQRFARAARVVGR